ncbi:Uma2 family endonuclease [soil metagenome]
MAQTPHRTTGLTYDDLVGMFPEQDNKRRELIDGELIVTASPSLDHQGVVTRLLVALHVYARAAGGEAFPAPLDIIFSEANVVEPDVVYVGPDKLDGSERRFLRAADVVVEVSSPSTRRLELVRKRRLYERFGVPEYWFVDLDADRIEVYRRHGAAFGGPSLLSRGDALESPLLPGWRVTVDEVLGPSAPD